MKPPTKEIQTLLRTLNSLGGYLGFCLIVTIFWTLVFGIVYLAADIK